MTDFTFNGQLTATNSRDENVQSQSKVTIPISGCTEMKIIKWNLTNIYGKTYPRSWIYVDGTAVKSYVQSNNSGYTNHDIGWNGSSIDLTGHNTLTLQVGDASYYGGAYVRFDYEFILE